MTRQYTSAGKEVLRDGVHFADACSPDEARDIAVAMNEGLARAYIELGECGTCKGVGAHQPECVERPPVECCARCNGIHVIGACHVK